MQKLISYASKGSFTEPAAWQLRVPIINGSGFSLESVGFLYISTLYCFHWDIPSSDLRYPPLSGAIIIWYLNPSNLALSSFKAFAQTLRTAFTPSHDSSLYSLPVTPLSSSLVYIAVWTFLRSGFFTVLSNS